MQSFITAAALSAAIFGTWKYLQLFNDVNQVPSVYNGQINFTTPAKCMQMAGGVRCVNFERYPCITTFTRSGHKAFKRPDYWVANCECGQRVAMNVIPQKGEILTPTATTL
jgi:hypothetical protein